MSSKLVFPQDHDTDEASAIKRVLRDAGFSDADSEWLIRVFRRPDCFGDTSGQAVFREEFSDYFEYVLPGVVEKLATPANKEADRQTRLALLFAFLLGFGPVYSEPVKPTVGAGDAGESAEDGRWIDEFRAHAGFSAIDLNWHFLSDLYYGNECSFQFYGLIPFLFPEGLPLAEIVNLDALNPVQRQRWSNTDFKDPSEVEFWLIWRFSDDAALRNTVNLHGLVPAFVDLPAEVLGEKVLGLLNAIGYAMNVANALHAVDLDHLNRGWRVVARELAPFLNLLDEKQPDSQRDRSPVLKAWWKLSVTLYGRHMGGLQAELSAERRTRLVESAARHFGFLRKELREAPDHFAGKDSTGAVADFYREAFYVLCVFAPPWKRVKPLLLAFTEMAVPAVASDLRPWPESDREAPPHPYSEVPMWIQIALYPQNLRDELEKDPDLRELREEFALFCLGRLKTKAKETSDYTDTDFIEPRPQWRQCYVQALAALRVNPGGRTHRTIFWLLNNDPDESVRNLARKVHRGIRHLDRNKPNLEEGASPRRPLFEAFWWLRQAHLLALGVEIDAAGAMRTRRRELHRTREKDDRLNWEA